MIFRKERDLRLVTIRRGGKLTDRDHQLMALVGRGVHRHVLHFFE